MFYHMHMAWETLNMFDPSRSDKYWFAELMLCFVVDAASVVVNAVDMGTKVVSQRRWLERGHMLMMSAEKDTCITHYTSGLDYPDGSIHDNDISDEIARHPRSRIDTRAWSSHP